MSQIQGNKRIRIFRRGMTLLIIMILVAAAGLAYWLTREKPPTVRTATIGLADITSTMSLTAVIEPGAIQTVTLSQQQQVAAVLVSEGDQVRQGDVLVTFDLDQLQETYDTAKAARKEAQAAVKKLTKMASGQASSGTRQIAALQRQLSGMGGGLESAVSALRGLGKTQPVQLNIDQAALGQAITDLQALDPNDPEAAARQADLTKQLLAAIAVEQNPAWLKQSARLDKSLSSLGNSMEGLFNSLGSAVTLLSGSSAASQLGTLSTQAQTVTQQAIQAEALAKAALDEAIPEIRAEFDGVVAELNAEAGETVGPAATMGVTLSSTATPILILFDNVHPQATLQANRYDASRLAVGQPVTYRLDNKTFSGQVTRKSAIASGTTGSLTSDSSSLPASNLLSGMSSGSLSSEPTLDVTLSLSGSGLTELVIGFNIDAEIQTAQAPSVLALPAEAVRKELGQYYVFVCNDQGVLSRRDFTAGIQSDAMVEVVSGLEPGLRVVLNPGNDLLDGSPVVEQRG